MKVIVRANSTSAQDSHLYSTVVEVKMTDAEVSAHAFQSPVLETAILEAVEDHLRCSSRVIRMVETGRG